MLLQRAGECLVALAILSSAAIDWRSSNGPIDFGAIDPTYRSANSDTAWFLNQDRDDAQQVPVAKDDDDGNDTAIADAKGARDDTFHY